MRLVMGFETSREYVDGIARLTRVPRAPSWLLGVFSSDGVPVPLVDIHAWARQVQPRPWLLPASTSAATGHEASARGTAPGESLRALRLGDGPQAWAIRVSEAPAVFGLDTAQASEVSLSLPLQVSSVNGRLMSHVTQIWSFPDAGRGVEVRWASVASALRQEMSGFVAKE
jgi:hypothetical protein